MDRGFSFQIKHDMKKRKNVILITIDSLRASNLSCLGYPVKTSPYLDKLAKEGILFKNAISCGPDTPTSITPLLTSSYVLTYLMKSERLKKFEFGREKELDKLSGRNNEFEIIGAITSEFHRNRTTISKVLKLYGYNTAAFHSNAFLSSHFNFRKEFDYLYDSITSLQKNTIKSKIEKILNKSMQLKNFVKHVYNKIHSNNVPYDRAEIINKKAISWLKNHKTDFFIWIHYMDVHFPYKPQKKFQHYFRSKSLNNLEMSILNDKITQNDYLTKPIGMSEEEISTLIDLYNGDIRYVDYSIKSLLEELKRMDILKDTLIVITADHGEQFWEHGEFGHGANLYDELIRVPLIIYNSEYKNIEIDETVSLLDASPTILDLLGISENKAFQGTSLIHIIKGEKKSPGVISETFGKGKRNISFRTKKWKYILNDTVGQPELYDLESDPKEEKNLAETEGRKAKEFELKIMEHISKHEKIIKGSMNKKERIRKIIRELKHYGKV